MGRAQQSRWLARILDRSVPLEKYRHEAGGWDMCAVGEVVKDFPTVVLLDPDQMHMSSRARQPLDRHIRHLGMRFAVAVNADDRKMALAIYDRIQTRVRTLLRKAGRAR